MRHRLVGTAATRASHAHTPSRTDRASTTRRARSAARRLAISTPEAITTTPRRRRPGSCPPLFGQPPETPVCLLRGHRTRRRSATSTATAATTSRSRTCAASSASILLDLGNGRFQDPIDSGATGVITYSVAVGFFNDDNKPNFATANANTNNVTVKLSTAQ
jgi:hypothetical protein